MGGIFLADITPDVNLRDPSHASHKACMCADVTTSFKKKPKNRGINVYTKWTYGVLQKLF